MRPQAMHFSSTGLAVDLVTGAGTGTFLLETASGVYGELQAGACLFMDADYARNQADPAINDLAAKAQVLAERSINYCADTSARVREQVDKYTDDATRYVKQQPGKSVVIAAAAGAALTVAAMALLRGRGD